MKFLFLLVSTLFFLCIFSCGKPNQKNFTDSGSGFELLTSMSQSKSGISSTTTATTTNAMVTNVTEDDLGKMDTELAEAEERIVKIYGSQDLQSSSTIQSSMRTTTTTTSYTSTGQTASNHIHSVGSSIKPIVCPLPDKVPSFPNVVIPPFKQPYYLKGAVVPSIKFKTAQVIADEYNNDRSSVMMYKKKIVSVIGKDLGEEWEKDTSHEDFWIKSYYTCDNGEWVFRDALIAFDFDYFSPASFYSSRHVTVNYSITASESYNGNRLSFYDGIQKYSASLDGKVSCVQQILGSGNALEAVLRLNKQNILTQKPSYSFLYDGEVLNKPKSLPKNCEKDNQDLYEYKANTEWKKKYSETSYDGDTEEYRVVEWSLHENDLQISPNGIYAWFANKTQGAYISVHNKYSAGANFKVVKHRVSFKGAKKIERVSGPNVASSGEETSGELSAIASHTYDVCGKLQELTGEVKTKFSDFKADFANNSSKSLVGSAKYVGFIDNSCEKKSGSASYSSSKQNQSEESIFRNTFTNACNVIFPGGYDKLMLSMPSWISCGPEF